MSKKSKSSGNGNNISINGQNKVSSYNNGRTTYTNYNMSDAEKAVYDYAQNALKNDISQINVFSPDTLKNMQSQINAYTQKGQDVINNTYTPQIASLKNDIASRFGNLDNSSFLNNLNSITNKQAQAESSLAQDVTAKQNELVSDELQQRYNFLNFMNDLQNQVNDNILNYVSKTATTSNNSNNNTSGGTNFGKYLSLASTILRNGLS
ncbi:MAG: DUF2092 domain-containing protein [Clostridiaceae bacterium]|jgi:hypothetical protein|nr:DUF2092 domain-containing protein [Clostridiaceae bacterium]